MSAFAHGVASGNTLDDVRTVAGGEHRGGLRVVRRGTAASVPAEDVAVGGHAATSAAG